MNSLPIRGLIFDLDDTLYLEKDYVSSGFQAVGRAIARTDAEATTYTDWMRNRMARGHDGRTFNHLLAAFPELAKHFDVTDLIQIYREHTPTLTLSEEWQAALREWRTKGMFLGLISDGELVGQERKLSAMNLRAFFDHIILTDRYGKEYWKPHYRAFEEIQRVSGLCSEEPIYVGDNVLKDFYAPNKLGWRTLRLRHAGQVRGQLEAEMATYRAQHEVSNFGLLKDYLDILLRETEI